MYHPYFRGKQYELITIRETAAMLSGAEFVPVVEPVKESLGGLERTLNAVCEANGRAIVIINPHHGDHAEGGEELTRLMQAGFLDKPDVSVGILLKKNMTVQEAVRCFTQHRDQNIVLVHAGFTDAQSLVAGFGARNIEDMSHIFLEPSCGKLYRKYFSGANRILIRDGFQKRRNRDHPEIELFSDLHVTFREEGMNGFGDFLTVGDDFTEGGGPAYAVAIHLTFIDPTKDDAMFIYHFVSERQDTPTDPAGKFNEALTAMMRKLNSPRPHVLETEAVREFRDLHRRGHFPGLGYVKKLSMKHHIETLSSYLRG